MSNYFDISDKEDAPSTGVREDVDSSERSPTGSASETASVEVPVTPQTETVEVPVFKLGSLVTCEDSNGAREYGIVVGVTFSGDTPLYDIGWLDVTKCPRPGHEHLREVV